MIGAFEFALITTCLKQCQGVNIVHIGNIGNTVFEIQNILGSQIFLRSKNFLRSQSILRSQGMVKMVKSVNSVNVVKIIKIV